MTAIDSRRYVVAETAIGTGMNVVMSLVAAAAASGGTFAPPATIDVVLQSFMVAFMSILVATLLTRMRRSRGRLAFGPNGGGRLGRLLPANAFLRALLGGIVCLAVTVPILAAGLPLLVAARPFQVGAATVAWAVLLSLFFAPAALILALRDAPGSSRVAAR